MVRSAMIDVLAQDYVRTARAKGVSERRVIWRHAVPNALLPIIAMVGIDIGQFMSGVVVVEAVYGWPGIGQLAWQAIQQVDIPIIMGVTLTSALAIVTGNLLADLVARSSIPESAPADRRAGNDEKQRVQEKGNGMLKTWLTRTALAGFLALAPVSAMAAGGTITVTYKDDIATLDPAIGYDWQNWSMIKSLYSRLMDYTPGTADLVPSLAESFEVSRTGSPTPSRSARASSSPTAVNSWRPT